MPEDAMRQDVQRMIWRLALLLAIASCRGHEELPESSAHFRIWQFEDRAVWLVLGSGGEAFQCRIERSVYRSEGRAEGGQIVWESIWGTDTVRFPDGAVILENENGSFRFHEVDVIERRCECPFSVPVVEGRVNLGDNNDA